MRALSQGIRLRGRSHGSGRYLTAARRTAHGRQPFRDEWDELDLRKIEGKDAQIAMFKNRGSLRSTREDKIPVNETGCHAMVAGRMAHGKYRSKPNRRNVMRNIWSMSVIVMIALGSLGL